MVRTIFALSSGALPSGVAVIRLSGPACAAILESLAGSVPPPRRAVLRTLRDFEENVIDRALVLFFPGPQSFTGEDCAEFHLHGGKAVVQRMLNILSRFPGVVAAEAGDFTRLAMESGKLSLLEVEGLADLLAAETEMQRRLAIEHSQGHLRTLYEGWMLRLTHARAMIEAELDFADEDDVPGSVSGSIWQDMEALLRDVRKHLSDARTGEIIRDGLKVAIIGPPNAGKSSLLNYLAKRDVAIVTPIAGTTRDVLSVDLDIGGYRVQLIDTAGLRDTDDIIEQEGIRRTRLAAEAADVVLVLYPPGSEPLTQCPFEGVRSIMVRSKADLDSRSERFPAEVSISTSTGYGIDQLLDVLVHDLKDRAESSSLAIPSRLRHRTLLMKLAEELQNAVSGQAGLELRAEGLRRAAYSLGKITGHVDTEGLLDVIFSSFCIGK